MHKNHSTKLSLTIHGYTISVDFEHSDLTLSEMFQAFRTVLVGATWNEEQIDEYIIETGDELSYHKKHSDE
jgi:hypothetical protein